MHVQSVQTPHSQIILVKKNEKIKKSNLKFKKIIINKIKFFSLNFSQFLVRVIEESIGLRNLSSKQQEAIYQERVLIGLEAPYNRFLYDIFSSVQVNP